MSRRPSTLLLLASLLYATPALSGFVLDPDTGTCISGNADGVADAGNIRPPITPEEKAAEAAKLADLREDGTVREVLDEHPGAVVDDPRSPVRAHEAGNPGGEADRASVPVIRSMVAG